MKQFAKKVALVAIVGALASTSLIACSSSDDSASSSSTGSKTTAKTVRSKNSTYSTK